MIHPGKSVVSISVREDWKRSAPLLSIYPKDPPIEQGRMLHYVHISLIYNSQKLERTQMSFNQRMDRKKNVVDLHSGVLLSY